MVEICLIWPFELLKKLSQIPGTPFHVETKGQSYFACSSVLLNSLTYIDLLVHSTIEYHKFEK